MADMYI